MRIKSFTEIMSRMIDLTLINTGEINDFSRSSVIYTLYQSIAMELELIGMLNRENVLEGIEKGIYDAFEFERRPARKAYGDLMLSFYSKILREVRIPRGTIFSSSKRGYNQTFELLESVIVPPGTSSVKLRVYAVAPGVSGNVPTGTIDTVNSNIYNIKEIENQEDFLTGRDEESLEEVKRRFREYVDSRGRATNKSIQYGVKKVEDISGVHIEEELGRVKVYAHDSAGNLSEELRQKVIEVVEDYRPSGIRLDVFPIIRTPVSLNAEVELRDKSRDTEEFSKQLEIRIRNHINSLAVSEELVVMELVRDIMNVDKQIISDLKITYPTENVTPKPEELLRADEVTVTLRVRGEAKDDGE